MNNSPYFWRNEQIELRMVEEDDQDFFMTLLSDTKIRMQANHGIAQPVTEAGIADMIAYCMECNESGEELWFIIENEEQEAVGYAVIDWMNEKMGNVQCHVTILEEFRRNGYGTAAAQMLLSYLFEERRFHKVCCCLQEDTNQASHQHKSAYTDFVRKLGFRTDGFRKEMFYTHGHYVGEFYYSLLKKEYKASKNGTLQVECEPITIPNSDLGLSQNKHDLQDNLFKNNDKLPDATNTNQYKSCDAQSSINRVATSLYLERPYFWTYEDITLRDMQKEDYIQNHEIIFDTEACVYYDSDVKLPSFSEELTEREEEHLHLQHEDDRIEYAIENEEGNYVGNINICGLDYKNGKFSFSIYMLPEYRDNGYATKALRLILTYCFTELRMHKMISCVNMGNEASAALMRNVGCTVEGVLRENEYYHGSYVDVVMFGVTKEEFELATCRK